MTTEQKILVTAAEAAKMLSMGQSTFWRKVGEKKLPEPVKIAGMTRWRVADLHACVETPASQPTTASAHAAA
ncbi:putative transcriptional regulator [Variovorax sp. PBL-H6]|nr:putative transcriptional regulator [Variovorax sp. PBL-H6]